MDSQTRAWMIDTVLLKRGESPWPYSLPVDAGNIECGEWYWLARYESCSYDECPELVRLPYAPFDSSEKANAFLEKNWPAWLGECDVVFDIETLYECDEDGNHLYGRDVYVNEVFDCLAHGVDRWCRKQFDEYVDNFYQILTLGQFGISLTRAKELCSYLKGLKLKWIAEEPQRIAARDRESENWGVGSFLSGLRHWSDPAITEMELVMGHGLNLVLDSGVLYGDGSGCSLEGVFSNAISGENSWIDKSGEAVLPKTLGGTSVADVDRS